MFNKQFFNQLGFIQTDIFEIVPSHIYVTDSPYENLKKKQLQIHKLQVTMNQIGPNRKRFLYKSWKKNICVKKKMISFVTSIQELLHDCYPLSMNTTIMIIIPKERERKR